MKKFFGLLVVVFFLCSMPAWSFDGYLPGDKNFDLQCQIFKVVHQSWVVNDLLLQFTDNPSPEKQNAYNLAFESYKKQSIDLGKLLSENIEEKNIVPVQVTSEIYKSFDAVTKQSLFLALSVLKMEIVHSLKSPLSSEQFREYFPGYGYSEPGYKYRKGKEVGREPKGTTWQQEEH
ncbi:hypothetical protein HYY75_03395, partial [bacterium]|nr:hypothetical protein [bacterium]